MLSYGIASRSRHERNNYSCEGVRETSEAVGVEWWPGEPVGAWSGTREEVN